MDYLEADRAFSLARRASPYSLEGLDVYSTVLYVSLSIGGSSNIVQNFGLFCLGC